MRRSIIRWISLSAAVVASLSAACTAPIDEDSDAAGEAVGTKNQTANAFGLKDKELILTLDDGPGARTVEVATWLAKEKVPAVFFSVGNNAKANPHASAEVVRLSNENNGLFIIGNHSMTHTTPLPTQGFTGARNEIVNADAVLTKINGNLDVLTASQKVGFPSQIPFFRPPYGAFTALGAANIDKMNAENAAVAKYSGPVFWDIGGELKGGFSADWACWGKNGVSIGECADGYIREATARKRGLMLAHDVHGKTIDMLIGTGAANGRSLIKDLRNLGFKFVGLRAHEDAVLKFAASQDKLSSAPDATIDATVDASEQGHVKLAVRAEGGAKVVVTFDNNAPTPQTTFPTGATPFNVESDMAPGQHFVTVNVLNAAGASVKQQRFTFIVAAPIEEGSAEAEASNAPDRAAACVNFNLLKKGNLIRLYNKEVGTYTKDVRCPEGSWNAPKTGKCYAYAGALELMRDPQLVGARDWSLDMELTYGCATGAAADPNYACDNKDKTRVSVVMDADTGEITSAKRTWSNGKQVPIDFADADAKTHCEQGLWFGNFVYPSGKKENVLFRMVKDPRSGTKIEN